MNRKTMINSLLLLITAMIWGAAFVAQSVGAKHVGPLTFLALRSVFGCVFLLPLVSFRFRGHLKEGEEAGKLFRQMLPAGGICGLFLFLASLSQQAGMAFTTAAKAGFITALYVVLVPVFATFLGRKARPILWFSVILSVAGLYLLSIKGGFQIEGGDTLVILAAFLFAVQILCLDHFAPKMDPILLSFLEYLTQGILAGILLPFFEHPTLDSLAGAMPAILYAGVFSTGIGYTLQVVAQKGLDPTIASMIMSLEGVFSAIFGWLILHEGLAGRELLGCGLMFVAVILASIFGGEKQEKIESGRDSTLRSE